MDVVAIVRGVAVVVGVTAAAMAAPIIAAAGAGETGLVGVFVATSGAGLFVAAALWLGVRGRTHRAGPRETILVLLLGWAAAAAIACPPLMTPESGVGRAYFDALSALTTTGFRPAFATPNEEIRIFWWHMLQWLGGAATIVTILVALVALNVSGAGVQRSTLFTLTPERLLERTGPVAGIVASIYSGATLVVMLGALAGGAGVLDSVFLAMASVSTGGLVLSSGAASAAGVPGPALVAASFGFLTGALSFAAHWETVRGRAVSEHLRDRETLLFLLLVWVWLTAAAFADPPRSADEGLRLTFEALALASTAGWDAGPLGVSALGAPLVLAAVLFGGAAISNAGGLKLKRVSLLVGRIGDEMRALSHPSSVSRWAHDAGAGAGATFTVMSGLGVYAVCYGVAIGALTGALGLMGAPLDVAAAGAVSALANAGPALAAATDVVQAQLLIAEPGAAAVLCVGMVLGRVEVLAAFAILLGGFWRG